MTNPVVARLRVDARVSAQRPSYEAGSDVVWLCDFEDRLTGVPVAATQVTMLVYQPDGTLLDPAPEPEAVPGVTGTWRITIPSVVAGEWGVRADCGDEGAVADFRYFDVVDSTPAPAPVPVGQESIETINGKYGRHVILTAGDIDGVEEARDAAEAAAESAADDAEATAADRLAVAADKATVAADKASVTTLLGEAQSAQSGAVGSATEANASRIAAAASAATAAAAASSTQSAIAAGITARAETLSALTTAMSAAANGALGEVWGLNANEGIYRSNGAGTLTRVADTQRQITASLAALNATVVAENEPYAALVVRGPNGDVPLALDERGALRAIGLGAYERANLPGVHVILRCGTEEVPIVIRTDGVLAVSGFQPPEASGGGGADIGDFSQADLLAAETVGWTESDLIRRVRVTYCRATNRLVLWFSAGQSLSEGCESIGARTANASYPNCFMIGGSVHPLVMNDVQPVSGGGPDDVWQPANGSFTLSPLAATITTTLSDGRPLDDAGIAALVYGVATNRGWSLLEGFAAQHRPAWLKARGKGDSDPDNRWVFASTGYGGSRASWWLAGAPENCINRIATLLDGCIALAAANGWDFGVGGMLWNQGETMDTDWLSVITQVFADIRALVATKVPSQTGTLPIFMVQTGGQYTQNGTTEAPLPIQLAQLAAAATIPGVTLVANNQAFPDRGDHLAMNGSRWLACQLGKAANKVLIDGQGFGAPRPVAAWHKGATGLMAFTTAEGVLRFASPWVEGAPAARPSHAGIYVADDAGALVVSNVRIVGEYTVAWDYDREPSGTVRVWVGRRDSGNIAGGIWFGDSDATPLAMPWVYEAGTGQGTVENRPEMNGRAYPAQNLSLANVLTSTAA
jgi:hypothetical protein